MPVTIPILGLVPGVIHAASFLFTGIFKLVLIMAFVKIIAGKKNAVPEAGGA